jgi:hypothetical protein
MIMRRAYVIFITALIASIAGMPGRSVTMLAAQTGVYLPVVVAPRESCSDQVITGTTHSLSSQA